MDFDGLDPVQLDWLLPLTFDRTFVLRKSLFNCASVRPEPRDLPVLVIYVITAPLQRGMQKR